MTLLDRVVSKASEQHSTHAFYCHSRSVMRYLVRMLILCHDGYDHTFADKMTPDSTVMHKLLNPSHLWRLPTCMESRPPLIQSPKSASTAKEQVFDMYKKLLLSNATHPDSFERHYRCGSPENPSRKGSKQSRWSRTTLRYSTTSASGIGTTSDPSKIDRLRCGIETLWRTLARWQSTSLLRSRTSSWTFLVSPERDRFLYDDAAERISFPKVSLSSEPYIWGSWPRIGFQLRSSCLLGSVIDLVLALYSVHEGVR